MFQDFESLSIRWRALPDLREREGLGQLDIAMTAEQVIAEGMSIGERDGRPFAARYRVECDRDWRVRRFAVRTTDGRGVSMHSVTDGRWIDAQGHARPALDGCVDIDLEGSPFTNTLPIRRAGLTPQKGAMEFKMLYIPFDSFEPFADGQRYTCLAGGRRFRYEAADGSFDAELTIDDHGLVIDYPPLFERL